MREIAITVRAAAAERVVNRLITLAPYGIIDDELGGLVVLRIRAPNEELPPVQQLAARAGDELRRLEEREVPDDWRQRRRLDYRHRPIGDICVRPAWAPAPDPPVAVDVVIEESPAFGSAVHPTTRGCIAFLRAVEQRGALADLGCGSGVLSIVAAKLGFAPVSAVDAREDAVSATGRNAARNGVELSVVRADLEAEPAPSAPTMCANVPLAVHSAIARQIKDPPDVVIVSGIMRHELEAAEGMYARLGLRRGTVHAQFDWIACMFTGDPGHAR